MGVWSFRALCVGFADRHWWAAAVVVVVVEIGDEEDGIRSSE